jgi:hypothetical protein
VNPNLNAIFDIVARPQRRYQPSIALVEVEVGFTIALVEIDGAFRFTFMFTSTTT